MNNKHQELVEEETPGMHNLTSAEVLEKFNNGIEEGEQRMLRRVLKIVDGHKVVYQEGDERFDSEAKNGDEKDHIDSSENETLDEVLESLNKLKALDKTPPNKV